MAKDYYKVLEIDKNASEAEIKKAYRRLAHKYHPDKSGGDEKKFKEVNEAYQVLSDKNRRAQYDQFGQAFGGGGFPGGNPFGGGFGFNINPEDLRNMEGLGDIFEMFFGGGMGRGRRKTYHRGADIEAVKEITLEEAFRGRGADIEFSAYVSCEKCGGAGHSAEGGFTKCSTCDGQGEVRETRQTFFGQFSQVKTCSKCRGQGEIPNEVCGDCRGGGRIKSEKKVKIGIAPGISDGQLIKVSGAGNAGERGAASGDLYIRVRVTPHPVFKRLGDDLAIKKDIDILKVIAGKKVEIPTVSGSKVKVEIPPGFNLREPLKISGEGMPRFGSGRFGMSEKRGDLYVEFDIKVPKVSKELKKFLNEEDSD